MRTECQEVCSKNRKGVLVSTSYPSSSVSHNPEAAILESHGIEVPSPSCHSNGEEGEMQEFTEQVNHRFSEQVGATSSLASQTIYTSAV